MQNNLLSHRDIECSQVEYQKLEAKIKMRKLNEELILFKFNKKKKNSFLKKLILKF